MNRSIKISAAVLAASVLAAGGTAVAVPTVRHVASAFWFDPARLPALPGNDRVHYERGAESQAQTVAAILPSAIAKVEAAQGRPFAYPVTVAVYRSPLNFAAANGVGTTGVSGVAFFGRVTLSPTLFSVHRDRMEAILTHELSHAHLQGWLPVMAHVQLPNWFKEGLAVLVSGGGGAERVSEADARDAYRRGDRIALNETGSVFNLTNLRFDSAPEIPKDAIRAHLAYREAALFVGHLRDCNPQAFASLLDNVLSGRSFPDSVRVAYGKDIPALKESFEKSLSE